MSVVLRVGGDKGIIRNLIICEISEELAKRNQIAGLRRIVQDIREIRERIVVLQIGRRIRTRVSRCGQALRVALPRLSGSYELTYHVVITYRSGEIVVRGDGLPGCQHEIIWNGRMRVGKILGRQTTLRYQTV